MNDSKDDTFEKCTRTQVEALRGNITLARHLMVGKSVSFILAYDTVEAMLNRAEADAVIVSGRSGMEALALTVEQTLSYLHDLTGKLTEQLLNN